MSLLVKLLEESKTSAPSTEQFIIELLLPISNLEYTPEKSKTIQAANTEVLDVVKSSGKRKRWDIAIIKIIPFNSDFQILCHFKQTFSRKLKFAIFFYLAKIAKINRSRKKLFYSTPIISLTVQSHRHTFATPHRKSTGHNSLHNKHPRNIAI